MCSSSQEMIRGTWSPVTVGSHLQDGRWLSATSAAYGYTCHVQRSRSPMFQTSFTATSAGTWGGQDTKKTPRAEEDGWCTLFLQSSDTCFLWCLQPKQPNLSPGWQLYCHFVGFLLTITTILIYPSFFLLLWLIWRTGQKATVTVEHHLLLINSFINWLYCWNLCWWCAHIFFLFQFTEGAFWLKYKDNDKSLKTSFIVLTFTDFSLKIFPLNFQVLHIGQNMA